MVIVFFMFRVFLPDFRLSVFSIPPATAPPVNL